MFEISICINLEIKKKYNKEQITNTLNLFFFLIARLQ